ncbi:MAG TPA: sugar ABC transporter substrate-binding protein, partial [Emcibacteraceae bacterium]|nr:sugar ABC transporter substrate-binding protein [Emcibacteraceae bacterium]
VNSKIIIMAPVIKNKKGEFCHMIKAAVIFVIAVLGFAGWQAMSDREHDPNNLLIVEVNSSAERTGLLRAQLDRFEEDNPGIRVDVISLSWGQAFEKLSMMIAGGQYPDVIEMPDFWLSRYVSAGQIADMTPYLEQTEFDDDLEANTFSYGSIRGRVYTVPYGYYLRAMLYNKKIFARAGIEKPPLTMDDFYEDAAKISALPGIYGYCHHGGRGGAVFYYWIMTTMNGSNRFFDNEGKSTFYQPGAAKGLTLIRDIYKNGYAPKDSLNWGLNETVSGFYSGTCAMLHQTPDALTSLRKRMDDDDYGSAPMPLGPGGNSFPHLGYIGWSVLEGSSNKAAAFKLVRHLLSRENNRAWAERSGLVPIYKGLSENIFDADGIGAGWLQTTKDPHYQYMINPNYLPDIAEFDSIEVVQSGQAMMLGEQTPEETARAWADFMTAAEKRWEAAE